jgi:hypothetical protein
LRQIDELAHKGDSGGTQLIADLVSLTKIRLLLFSIAFADQGLGACRKKKSLAAKTRISRATERIKINGVYIRNQLTEAQGMAYITSNLNSSRPEHPQLDLCCPLQPLDCSAACQK